MTAMSTPSLATDLFVDDTTDRASVAPGRWPLVGVAAGVAALVSTTVLAGPFIQDTAVYAQGPEAIHEALAAAGGRMAVQLGAALGYATAALLVPFGIGLVRTLHRRAPDQLGLVVGTGIALAAAVATSVVGFVLKSIYASGMPGGVDADWYTHVDVAVSYTLANQAQYAGFLPVIGAAAAVAVLALRHGALQRWIGVLSAVLAVGVAGVTIAFNLPWSAGLATPIWLVAVSIAVLRLRRRGA